METDLKKVFIPLSKEQRDVLIFDFENKTGLSLPTDEKIKETIDQIFKEDKGTWTKVIPEEILSLLLIKSDEITDIHSLIKFREKLVSFCYEQSSSYSASIIAKLFGLCILKTVLIWSENNYVIAYNCHTEDMYKTICKGKEIKDPVWDQYSQTLSLMKIHYDLFIVPLECINKAYFGEKDIEWHSSEISVISINAVLRVFIETKQGEAEIASLLGHKYYNLIRGKVGVSTPARKEYQQMMRKVVLGK